VWLDDERFRRSRCQARALHLGEIGETVGSSKQAAWNRWGQLIVATSRLACSLPTRTSSPPETTNRLTVDDEPLGETRPRRLTAPRPLTPSQHC